MYSGGLYYASAVLAPPGWGPVASWATGWSSWIGQVTGAPSVNYSVAAMILAARSITDPSYTATNWELFLLTTLLMLVQSCISSMPTKWIAMFNSLGSSFNMVAVIIVIILIPAGTTTEHLQVLQRSPNLLPVRKFGARLRTGPTFQMVLLY